MKVKTYTNISKLVLNILLLQNVNKINTQSIYRYTQTYYKKKNDP